MIVQSVSVANYENRDKSRKNTKFGIHVLEGIQNKFRRAAT